jgi:lysozyme family protein
VKDNFERALRAVLLHEGGFVNHPSDPGGMTNLGCTRKVWEEWCGHEVDEKAMRALTPEKVAPLYKAKYWDKICGDDLPSGVDYCVFDCAINSGPGRAVKFLQQIVHTSPDGVIGPMTLKAVQETPGEELIRAFSDLRLTFLQALSMWDVFGKGWGRRVQEVQDHALAQRCPTT